MDIQVGTANITLEEGDTVLVTAGLIRISLRLWHGRLNVSKEIDQSPQSTILSRSITRHAGRNRRRNADTVAHEVPEEGFDDEEAEDTWIETRNRRIARRQRRTAEAEVEEYEQDEGDWSEDDENEENSGVRSVPRRRRTEVSTREYMVDMPEMEVLTVSSYLSDRPHIAKPKKPKKPKEQAPAKLRIRLRNRKPAPIPARTKRTKT